MYSFRVWHLSAEKQTYGDETRYAVKDHWGTHYVDHHEKTQWVSGYLERRSEDDYIEMWRKETSPTADEALSDHAPLSWNGTVLPPDTRITRITIETLSENKSRADYTYYVLRTNLPTFLVNPKEIKFYSFERLDGAQEAFLYSDIRHISFTEV